MKPPISEGPKGEEPTDVFPDTLWSVVRGAGVMDRERAIAALGQLCVIYRRPIYLWLRRAGYSHHAADDAAQDLVRHLLAKERLPELDPSAGRFRAWLITALRNLMRDQHEARGAAKRGGGAEHVSLEGWDAPGAEVSWDALLDSQLARVIHERALEGVRGRWRAKQREVWFERLSGFIRKDPEPGAYENVGSLLSMDARKVRRAVFDLRESYAEFYRGQVAELTEVSDLTAETRYLLSCEMEVGFAVPGE